MLEFSAKVLFMCPTCEIGFAFSENDTKAVCSQCGFSLEFDGEIWVNSSLRREQPENYCEDINYISRLSLPYTTTARETVQYERLLKGALESLAADTLILDLGCGDGRFTKFFLAHGVQYVIAVDYGYQNVKRLASRLTPEEKERVIILQADAARLPLKKATVGAIFAIGLLNVLIDHLDEILPHLRSVLSPSGILINTDPTLEGSLLYALVRHDFREFFQVFRTHTKTLDYDGEREKRYSVFENGALEAQLEKAGFTVEEVKGIPVFPSLIFGGVLQTGHYEEQLKEELVKVTDQLAERNIPVHRVRMYCSRKVV